MSTNETKATNETKTAKANNRVEIFVPRTPGNNDPNDVIVINGKNYVLPKGQKSIVPKAVAAEYERKQRAQYKVDDVIFERTEKAKQQAAAAGIK